MEINDASERALGWRWPLVLGGVVVAIWISSGLLIDRHVSDRGTFGDMFGAVNALFSGLAFAGVIYAILLQRAELRLQRKELELTRAELQGQKEQLRAQNETFRKDNFENTFFQLLRLHNDIVNSIDLEIGGRTVKGRDCFGRFVKDLHAWLSKHQAFEDREKMRLAYDEFYRKRQSELGHYFRLLYNMVKFVKHSDVTNKRYYTNLVRAQLSSYELTLLFFNCLTSWGELKFKPMIEEFALLKNLSAGEFPGTHLRSQYRADAFGE